MKACSSTAKAALAPPAAQHGFTLVELLVAVSLGSVVLASLGGGLLLSELKVSATVQRNLYAKDAANRAIDLMRREASFSRFFSSNTLSSGGVLDSCTWATPIAYVQPNNDYICYKTVAPSDLPAAYRSVYQGPCVLVRRGPPYKPDGTLDLTAMPIVQVLLDGVARTGRFAGTLCPSTTAFEVTYGSLTSPSIDGVVPLTRDANVAINLASGVRYSFSVRAASNPAYNGKDLYPNCTGLSYKSCGPANEASYHFRPRMNAASESMPGSPSRENLFYFQYPFSEYTLRETAGSGSCTYANCYVERGGFAVEMTNVDALIFADQEIRPST
ncbi:MAG: prepilin-type N-terminal cleavage/methylation domain-containing protein [Cyanobacteria bacterium]|nr:prepilin-type N-terminal cleavage/methylation domain-containing protein [Cyanobacteriota bacterium]